MTGVWNSFTGGWTTAARLWPVVLLLYAVDAALALALAMPVGSELAAAFGYSAMAPRLVEVPSLDLLVELASNTNLTRLPWLLYLLIPLISLIVTTFLRGGLLEALARGGIGLSGAEYFSACARFFLRLILILLLLPVGFVVLAIVAAILGVALGSLTGLFFGSATQAMGLVVQPLAIALLLAMADYARVSLVLEPRRSVFRHVWRGVRFTIGRLPQTALMAFLFWAIAAMLAGLFPLLLGPWSVPTGFWAALVVQQLSALLASWHRVAMLGAEMRLFSSANQVGTRAGELSH